MLKMMKQVRQVRKIQKELAAKTVTIASTDKSVTIVARGDMTIKSITIDPAMCAPDKVARLEKTLCSTVNSSLDAAKKAAAGDMQKLSGDLGLGGLFGG
jgi:DNA-binding protein YbaB